MSDLLNRRLALLGEADHLSLLTRCLHGIERVPGGWRGGADLRREGIAKGD